MKKYIYYNSDFYDGIKKILSLFYFIMIRIFNRNAKYVGAKTLTKKWKNSDTLFALASGASINSYNDKDFIHIGLHDSIAVSFFLIHEFIPTFYLTETHNNNVGWFDLLKKKKESIYHVPIIYKSYSSPKKIWKMITNALAMRKNSKNFFIIKESFLNNDFDHISKNKLNRSLNPLMSDYFYNYVGSINFVVMMGYKMGYKNIVLSGFDMGKNYFYCEDKKYFTQSYPLELCKEKNKNKIADNVLKKENIIKTLIYIDQKLKKERDGGVYVYSEKMSLKKYLRIYEKD